MCGVGADRRVFLGNDNFHCEWLAPLGAAGGAAGGVAGGAGGGGSAASGSVDMVALKRRRAARVPSQAKGN